MTKSEHVLSLEVILSLEKSQIVISPCLMRSEAHDLMMEKTPTNKHHLEYQTHPAVHNIIKWAYVVPV